MRISDWSSDVCSSDLERYRGRSPARSRRRGAADAALVGLHRPRARRTSAAHARPCLLRRALLRARSEEHTSELQSLMRISYAVFCLKKKKKHITEHSNRRQNISEARGITSNANQHTR